MQNQADEQLTAPKKAIENFWYHYKWHTIIIVFFAVFFIIAAAQMSSKNDYDAHILYTGPKYVDGETAKDIISVICTASNAQSAQNDNPAEYTGDGVLSLDFNNIVYVPASLAEEYRENDIYFDGLANTNARGQFDNLMMVGEYVILLVEKSLYDETVGAGAFLTWEESLGYTPEGVYDECGILLADLPIGAENGFRQLPEDTVLCCRGKSYVNQFNKKVQNEEMYDAQCALFRQIIEYVP